jgi:hypothetical protein
MNDLKVGDLAVVKHFSDQWNGTTIRISHVLHDGYYGKIVEPSKLCQYVTNTDVFFLNKNIFPVSSDFYELVEAEAKRGLELHGPITSLHEGYAVILEEIDEIWDEVKKKKPDKENLLKECVQAAAILKKLYYFIEQKYE